MSQVIKFTDQSEQVENLEKEAWLASCEKSAAVPSQKVHAVDSAAALEEVHSLGLDWRNDRT